MALPVDESADSRQEVERRRSSSRKFYTCGRVGLRERKKERDIPSEADTTIGLAIKLW